MSQSSFPRIDTRHMSFCSISDYLILSYLICCFLPHANEVWGKVIFSDMCHSVHGGWPLYDITSCLAAWFHVSYGGVSVSGPMFLLGGGLCPRGSLSGGCLHAEGCLCPEVFCLGGSLSGGSPDHETPPGWRHPCPDIDCLGGVSIWGVSVHGLPWTETPRQRPPKTKYLWTETPPSMSEVFA